MSTINRKDQKEQGSERAGEVGSTPANGFLSRCEELRQQCGKAINHPNVQLGIVVLIFINAIMMGVGTYFNDGSPTKDVLETIDLVFLIIFTVELVLQFSYYGLYLFTDGWLIFDFIIIVVSWLFQDWQVVRALRIFRALRLITRIKVMKDLVTAVFAVFPAMGSILLIILLILYIFAVLCTDLYKNFDPDLASYSYYGSLELSVFTLLSLTTMDGWSGISRETMDQYSITGWIIMTIYVFLTGIIIFNLLIAVICEAVSESGDEVKEKLHGSFSGDELSDDDNEERRENFDKPDIKDIISAFESLEKRIISFEKQQEQATKCMEFMIQELKRQKNNRSSRISN